ncbi:SspB family protein [Neoroseomonas rubea]|uniref:SspB family protein n=1 Tax=Neoroseomonas rubea TaxID=2748666 RepID=UPI0018DF9273|nr:ClpXP protease specificity-enhancing factor SspB [Roseomonas rubea]
MSDDAAPPESLMPYEAWAEEALREVAIRAIERAAAEGLPGEHHFYLTFRTDHPGTSIPGHLKARYPQEITIVLQHQFEDLNVDRAAARFSVTLYFGGVPSRLVVPFGALTMFHDPHVRFGLRFPVTGADAPPPFEDVPEEETRPAEEDAPPAPPAAAQVVSLDAFRRKPAKES